MTAAQVVAGFGIAIVPSVGVWPPWPTPAAAQSAWTASARMAIVEHRVDAGFGKERFNGWALGLEIARQFGSRVTVGIVGQGTQLRPAATGDLDRRAGEITADARLAVASWWGFYSGLTLRSLANDAGRQRWFFGRIGAEIRPAFTGGSVRAIGRLGVVPAASVSGLPVASFGLDGAVGLDYDHAGVKLGLVYGLERFGFPTVNGVRRSEQLSTLTFRGGIRLARRRA